MVMGEGSRKQSQVTSHKSQVLFISVRSLKRQGQRKLSIFSWAPIALRVSSIKNRVSKLTITTATISAHQTSSLTVPVIKSHSTNILLMVQYLRASRIKNRASIICLLERNSTPQPAFITTGQDTTMHPWEDSLLRIQLFKIPVTRNLLTVMLMHEIIP